MSETVKYQPNAPIASAKTLQGLLQRQEQSLRDLLPKHVTPERLMKTMMVAVNRTPQLLQCTQSSVLEAIMRSAELGLDVSGTLGEGYLVPFKSQATFIPGYRGLAKLARQSGEVVRIESNVVYEKDFFDFSEGTEFRLTFKRSLEADRGQKLGAYALAELRDGMIQAEWMTVAEVEKIRAGAMSSNSPAWKNHWDEMAKKTVFRRLAKWLPLSGEKWTAAVEIDNADFSVDEATHHAQQQSAQAASLEAELDGEPVEQQPPEDAQEPPQDEPPPPADPEPPAEGETQQQPAVGPSEESMAEARNMRKDELAAAIIKLEGGDVTERGRYGLEEDVTNPGPVGAMRNYYAALRDRQKQAGAGEQGGLF